MSETGKRTVISRRVGQAIRVAGPARVELLSVTDHRVTLAVEAAPDVAVVREERA